MLLTVEEVIEKYCEIAALVYHSIGDYSCANDGFCNLCPPSHNKESFRNEGQVIDFVREACVKLLKEKGFQIDKNFDLEIGKFLIEESTTGKLLVKEDTNAN